MCCMVLHQYQWRMGEAGTDKPTKTYTFEEAAEISGIDPDHSKRDLYKTIENGGEFKWTLNVQVSPPGIASIDYLRAHVWIL